jgi:tetratricopeptide (TPR) repeat protein
LTAIKYFKQVLLVSQDPKIYFGMGSAYFSSNQREKALEMITKLHILKADDLAAQLETSMRKDLWVNARQPDPPQDNTPTNAPAGTGQVDPTPDKPTGMQARLRGKLSDY